MIDVDQRSFVPSDSRLAELTAFIRQRIPGAGQPLRTVTCQYALTPDRHFVVGAIPEHPRLIVGLGAGHAFKFAPTIGRVLSELAVTGSTSEDLTLFRPDRPALGMPLVAGTTA